MRIYALELNNDIKGIEVRKEYIESLISKLPSPDLVVLPELSICGYMASQEIWKYADDCGKDTSEWAVQMAKKYRTLIGTGYLDKEEGDYYNRYMIAEPEGVCGVVSKSEGEAAVFMRGDFDSIIRTPFGNVAVGICYDSRRKHFYDNIKDAKISLILFPHGSAADPNKPKKEIRENERRCMPYVEAFGVPVVYVNSKGKLEYMPGKMGSMMAKAGFRMNGRSKIYASEGKLIRTGMAEAVGIDIALSEHKRQKDIRFYGEDIVRENWFFRTFVLKPDTQAGVRLYELNR
jgi:predicted amidohydrolase